MFLTFVVLSTEKEQKAYYLCKMIKKICNLVAYVTQAVWFIVAVGQKYNATDTCQMCDSLKWSVKEKM
jgi:hypothetical protein